LFAGNSSSDWQRPPSTQHRIKYFHRSSQEESSLQTAYFADLSGVYVSWRKGISQLIPIISLEKNKNEYDWFYTPVFVAYILLLRSPCIPIFSSEKKNISCCPAPQHVIFAGLNVHFKLSSFWLRIPPFSLVKSKKIKDRHFLS
jgi:hypothetical protein